MNGIILPVLLTAFSIPSAIDKRFDWKDIQDVGGLRIGKSVVLYLDSLKAGKEQLLIPVSCDVSGTREITVKPQKLNSGLVFKEFKHKIKGNKIYFYLVATLPGKRHKSPATTGIYLKGIKPGDYEVYYLDSDKKSVPLGTVGFRNPAKVRPEQLTEPADYFKKAITLLESLDFYPQKNDSAFRRIEPTEHWLCNSIRGLDEIFFGIKEIRSVYLTKSSPEIHESQKYFPEVSVEEWVFCGKKEAAESFLKLDKFRQSDRSAAGDLLLKAPIMWWQEGERVYVLHTRAEMFREHLPKIEEKMKGVLSQVPESLY